MYSENRFRKYANCALCSISRPHDDPSQSLYELSFGAKIRTLLVLVGSEDKLSRGYLITTRPFAKCSFVELQRGILHSRHILNNAHALLNCPQNVGNLCCSKSDVRVPMSLRIVKKIVPLKAHEPSVLIWFEIQSKANRADFKCRFAPIKFVLTIKTASMSASGFRLIAQLEQGVGVGAIVVDELYEHLHLIDSLKR
jgi:hypothetical protein